MTGVSAPCEIERETDECEEGDDLEGETRDHDIVSELGVFPGVGFDGGDAAAGGLEEEGEDVAWDELLLLASFGCRKCRRKEREAYNTSIHFRLQPTILRPKSTYDPPQTQINPSS